MVDLLKLKNELRTLPLAARRSFQLSPSDLAIGYRAQRAQAPARAQGYLSAKRSGVTSSRSASTRAEEHLAVGLFNRKHLKWPDGSLLKLIDYQFPLKSVRDDAGIGKIDLLGLRDDGTLAIIELKVEGNAEDRRIALIEGLIYAAIVESNLRQIAAEVFAAHGQTVSLSRPQIIVLGSPAYWSDTKPFPGIEDVRVLAGRTAVEIECAICLMKLHDAKLTKFGLDGQQPEISGDCSLSYVFDDR